MLEAARLGNVHLVGPGLGPGRLLGLLGHVVQVVVGPLVGQTRPLEPRVGGVRGQLQEVVVEVLGRLLGVERQTQPDRVVGGQVEGVEETIGGAGVPGIKVFGV